jgi:hypothetical protein
MLTNEIETKLSDAIRLLIGSEYEYKHGNKQYALNGVKEVCARLLVLKTEMEAELAPADDALQFGCGHCGHECAVTELHAGKCPRCGTVKDGVLVVPKVDKWREREEALLVRPQPKGVRLGGMDI